MALKTDFEDANFISSPFVDEVANPGDEVVRAASPQQLARQGASTGAVALREAQIAAEKAPKAKTTSDERNTGQKIMDRDQKIREALEN